MFTAEVRINSTLITHIYGRNVKNLEPGVCEYIYECYTAETRKVVNGKVTHRQSDGINKLVADILLDAETKRKL